MKKDSRVAIQLSGFLAVVLLAACESRGSPEQRAKDAEQRIDAGEYTAAIIDLKNLLEKHPASPAAELALARASLMANNMEEAAKVLEDAQSHGADSGRVSELRVLLLRQSGAPEALLQALDSDVLKLEPAERELARAQALAAKRNCADAIRGARPLLAETKVQVAARVVLAECYAQAGARRQSLELLESATKLAPDNAEAWTALARVRFLSGDAAAAERAWREAAKHSTGRLTVLQQLGIETSVIDIQLARGDLAGARESLARAVKIAPQSGLTALLDARLRIAGGDLSGGEPLIAALVGRAPDFEAARIAWASALLAVGKREQALSESSQLAHRRPAVTDLAAATEVLKAGVALPAGTEEFWLNNAHAQLLLGQPALARQALDKAEVVAPRSRRVAVERIRLELGGGNAPEALRRAQALVAQNPDDDVALLLLAQAQRHSGNLNASLEVLRRVHSHKPGAGTAALIFSASRELGTEEGFSVLKAWIDSHPEEGALRMMLAEGLLSVGRNREAIAQFENILARNPNVVVALNNLAWVYHLEKDPRAVETARKAFKLAPKAAQVADTYAWLLLEQGAHADALQVLLDADAAGPLLDPESRYHLAVALARNGRNEASALQLSLLLLETGDFQSRSAAEALAARLK